MSKEELSESWNEGSEPNNYIIYLLRLLKNKFVLSVAKPVLSIKLNSSQQDNFSTQQRQIQDWPKAWLNLSTPMHKMQRSYWATHTVSGSLATLDACWASSAGLLCLFVFSWHCICHDLAHKYTKGSTWAGAPPAWALDSPLDSTKAALEKNGSICSKNSRRITNQGYPVCSSSCKGCTPILPRQTKIVIRVYGAVSPNKSTVLLNKL